MLFSLISPDNNNNNNDNRNSDINNNITPINNSRLVDNYDIQQMDIVDDHPILPPLPLVPPPPPPLPPNHLSFFDPLPPLPPAPPSLFDIFAANQAFPPTNWPRPNFVQQPPLPSSQTDLWQPTFNNTTDVDLRLQPANNINDKANQHHLHPHHHHHHHHQRQQQHRRHHSLSQQSSNKNLQREKRKHSKISSKKQYYREQEFPSIIISKTVTNHIENSQEQSPPLTSTTPTTTTNTTDNNNNNNNDDDEEERLLREELLRTLSKKRKVKPVEQANTEPKRIVTIVPSNSSTEEINSAPVKVNKPAEKSQKSQYTINQRYKRVKANSSSKTSANQTETITTNVVRMAQPIIQTRNKIVRVVRYLCFV